MGVLLLVLPLLAWSRLYLIVERLLGSLDLTSEERDAVRQALGARVRERAAGKGAAPG